MVPLSSTRIDVPNGSPPCPAKRPSKLELPVEVTGLPSAAEGRTPGDRTGVVVVELDCSDFRPSEMPILRLRKDIVRYQAPGVARQIVWVMRTPGIRGSKIVTTATRASAKIILVTAI